MQAQVLWLDPKTGAGRGYFFDAADEDGILRLLKKLRCEARVDFNGRTVGGVEDTHMMLGSQADDHRIRWNWWLERGFANNCVSTG